MISILYVDDESGLLEIGKLFLEQTRLFTVDTVTSITVAFTLLNSKNYDAIISDYQMPEMDGIEFLKTVRKQFGDIPFILFTGRGREEVVIEAINNGADYYLQKGGQPQAQFAELSHKIGQAVRRKQTERSLRDSERRLSDIIDFLPDATFAIDRSGHVIAWNRAIEEMTGAHSRDLLGKGNYEYAIPFYGYHRQLLIDLIDESDEKIAEFYSDIYRTGNSLTAQTNHTHPKGHYISVLIKVCPLYNQKGEITGAIETIRDITDRKRAEEELTASYEQISATEEELRLNLDDLTRQEMALRVSEERYRNVVEDQTEFISRFLPDGTHVFVNDAYCRYFGLKRDEILGHWFRPKIPTEDQERVRRFFISLTPDHPVDTIEQQTIMPDGGVRWQRWSDRAIFDSSGKVTEYQSVGRDITEYKKAEEALRQANDKLRILFSITRHDINNQLSLLKEYLVKLEKKQPDISFGECFKNIMTTAERITAMIQFAKTYEEIGVKAPVWQECHTLVDTAAKQVPLGKVMVKNDIPVGTGVLADPLIVKVCYNLIDNAIRYGGKVTTIQFSVQESGDDRLIICEDNGDGVNMDEKKRIFEKGFGKNTGLGLFLAHEILSITGITIVETGEPGKGARFEMTVPKDAYRLANAQKIHSE
ncbi:MAG: PAS domain S-box protein [Methanoregula sp.]|jgi:PAS domain S-box-containing protein|nr:PAS domain S-box protein [Methanoregula sp.]